MLLKLVETLKALGFLQTFLIVGLLLSGRTHLAVDVAQAFYCPLQKSLFLFFVELKVS